MEKNASGKSQKVYTNVNCKKERLQDYSNQMQLEASIMVIRVVEFSSRGTKFERFLPKNQHTQRKSLNFENWCNTVNIYRPF